MVGLLLESRADRPHLKVGTVLSIAAHVVIIAGATAATGHRTAAAPERLPAVAVRFTAPPASSATARHSVSTFVSRSALTARFTVPRIAVPSLMPVSLPVLAPKPGSIDSGSIASLPNGAERGRDRTLDLSSDGEQDGQLHGAELLLRILTFAKPRYPDALRQAGVGGRVLIRFTVDTSGLVDMASLRVIESTNEMFAAAVLRALPAFRFKPSRVSGRLVPSLAEMPFEFSIAK